MTLEEDAIGVCTRCYEWTSVRFPCCNASVYYEGEVFHPIEFLIDSLREQEE